MMDITRYNRNAWNGYVDQKNRWTLPVSQEEIENARQGQWQIVLTPVKPVPHNWFPMMKQAKVLGLACGGGQQGPIMAALGAEVTIFDNSENQLNQDRMVSIAYNLSIQTVQGDMQDLSVFPENSFDLIFNPCSVVFVPDVKKVWKECYRVLKPGGVIMTGLINPVLFQLSEGPEPLQLIHSQPYSDITSLPAEKLQKQIDDNEALEFGHSLSDQIGGQLEAGFVITHFYEDYLGNSSLQDKYLPLFFATRALKM